MSKQSQLSIDDILSSANGVETDLSISNNETSEAQSIDDILSGFQPTSTPSPETEKDESGFAQFSGKKDMPNAVSTADDAPPSPDFREARMSLDKAQRELAKDKQIAAATAPQTPEVSPTGFNMPKVDMSATAKTTTEDLTATSPIVKKQVESLLAPKQPSIIEADFRDFTTVLPYTTEDGSVRNYEGQQLDKATIRSFFTKDKDGTYQLPNGKAIYSAALFEKFVDEYYKRYNHPILMQDENYRKDYIMRNYGKTEEKFIADATSAMNAQLDRIEEAYEQTKPKVESTKVYPYVTNDEPRAVSKSLRDLRKKINSISKDNFWSGFNESFDIDDILALGLPSLGTAVNQLSALNKYVNGEELTPEENLYVQLNMLSQQIDQFRGEYRNDNGLSMNRVGNIVGFMPQFATQIGVTSKVIPQIGAKAVKDITLKAVADTMKKSASEGLKMGLKKIGTSMLNDAIATPFMTMTHKVYADRRLGHYNWEEENLVKENTPWAVDYLKALGETFVERHSEQIGEWVTGGLLYGGKRLAQSKLLDNTFGRGVNRMLNYKLPPMLEQARKNLRVSGYIGEVASEIYNNVINPVFTGETDSWKELLSGRYYWDLLTSIAISTGSFYSLGVPDYIRQGRSIKQLDNSRAKVFANISSQPLKDVLQSAFASDNLEVAVGDLSAVDWKNISAQDAKAASEYIFDTINSKLLQAEAVEAERLQAFMPIVEGVTSSLYSGGSVMAPQMGTQLQTAELKDGSTAFIIWGDVQDTDTTQFVVKAADGKLSTINREDIAAVKSMDMSDYLAEQYSLMFSDSINKERLTNFIKDLNTAQQNNASPEAISTIYDRSGYVLFNEGDSVTLTDGSIGVVAGYRDGKYLIAEPTNPNIVSAVGFLNILQPNVDIATAQVELVEDINNGSVEVDTTVDDSYVSEEDILRQKLESAAKQISTADGKDIYVIRLADGREATVKQGQIVLNEDGTIDTNNSTPTIVIRDAESQAIQQIGIEEVDSVIEELNVQEAINAVQSSIEEHIAKRDLIAEIFAQKGVVDVILISGNAGQIVEILTDDTYTFNWIGEDKQTYSIAITLDQVAEVLPPKEEKEESAATETDNTESAEENAFEGFNPEPINFDKVDWDNISTTDYINLSVLAYGPAETLSRTRGYYLKSKENVAEAQKRVEAQDAAIAKLKAKYADLTGPGEAVKLDKKVREAEAEKVKRIAAVTKLEQEVAKYAKTLAQLGVNIQEEVAIINDRKNLEKQKAELVEADANLDKFAEKGASEAVNSIVNNETNRNRIYNLYVSRGVAPDQAGVTSAVLWDIVTGNVHLRWEDYKTGAGNVEKGLGSELGLANSSADKRAYKAVLDRNGISVDSYVHSLWERMDGYSNELDDMDMKNEVLSVLQSTPNGTVALQTLYDALGIEDAAEELYSMNKAEIAQQMADIDKRIAENAVAQTEFNKKVQNKIDQLEGKNVPTIAQKSQTTPQTPAKLSEQHATEIIEAIPGGVSYSENKGTTNIPENPKNQQEISDDEFFGAVKSNNTQAIQSSSLADDEFFGATRANKKKSGNQENSKESNTFVENNDTDGREETDIRRDNIPSLEAGADNSSRVDTVDATGASFSEQSGNNISDGRGDIRVFEQGLGGKHSWSDADNERDLQREVSQRLVEIAEDNGLFIPLADTKNLGEKYQGRTGESTVYIDEAAGKVYKVKNPYAKSALKKVAPQDAIYEHIVHNLLFPEAPYKFEGISKDVDGVRIVLSQPFINNEDSPSQSQIEQALAARGLYPDGKYSYGNDLVSVTDVEGDNVILGENGTVYFIDPIIKFKKPVAEIIEKLSEQTSEIAPLMIGNFKIVAPEGTSAEKWAAVVEHLKEIIGAGNVITDEEQMRQILNNLLQSGEIRTMIKTKGFYSDAERAVEEIKQEKATPQQWLAMLQKNGGLKAGEDKWIGLSDWLKASEKKTLTKQEVLDYIGVNKIQIEEVEYADSDTDSYTDLSDTPEFQELKDEFEHLRSRIIADEWHKADKYSDSLIEKYGFQNNTIDMEALSDGERDTLTRLQITDSEAVDLAWVEMLDRYGDDFEIAFDTFGGGLSIKDEDAARSLLGISDSTKPINSVRKKYTTVGLNNLREIALTVPTIDSWRKDDNVHFGDAGEGRAIAWIRFGETTAPREVEIVREAVLEAPFKAYNGHDIYRVKDTNGKHFIIYGKLKNGQMMYVPQINGKYIGETVETAAFDTLEQAQEALAAYYKAHPIRKTINERILVIDEIQSNRHQEGRKRGYESKEDKAALDAIIAAREELGKEQRDFEYRTGQAWRRWQNSEITEQEYNEMWNTQFDAENKVLRAKQEAIDAQLSEYKKNKKTGVIPAAPFESNWAELAFKRMLRYAAENGFDKVAWTTGAQQAERYNLSKDIDYIEASVNENGTYNINVATTDDSRYLTEKDVTEERLSELVGKEIALAIIQGTQNSQDKKFTLEGDNLQIGGEGMKAFYDKMLVSFINKYGKKWDARVGEVTMPELDENNTMHAVDVTNAMRISVLEGQPMFRAMKTSKGEVYGFTYNGKIYLDPTTMNVEAPIHEYTELWSAVIEKQNPELWAKGKELLKQTNMWKVVNSDPNYKNLPEDLRASETLSRIVAAEAAKKINEVSDSKNLIAKLRAWIRKFWNTLKATFSKWSAKDIDNLTLREFKAMPLRDFIEGVNPLDYQVSNISGFAPSLDAKELDEIRAERKQIEEQAKVNGTWLKAPNGQPTNLTPEQWVTVRTRRFKEWFGDWEVLWKGVKNVKILQYPNSREEALAYLATLQQPFKNEDQQVDIFVSNRDARHTMQFRNIDQIRVIGGIKDIIKNAVYVYDAKVDDDEVETVKAVHIYYCPVFIDGTQYSARMVVKEYYQGSQVINELHLYNVMLKKRHQTNTLSQDGTPHMRSDASIHYKVSDLIHNTQELAQINFSKIVDANGEPKVVYHGTPNDFTVFDEEKRGSSTDRGIWGNGFYFSASPEYADTYAKRNGVEGKIMPLFLNARNPLFISLKNGGNEGAMYFNSLQQKYFTDDVYEDIYKVEENMARAQKELSNEIVSNGYDGIIIEYSHPTIEDEYVTFEPNQIKSVDNAGYFDPNNDDIRYTLGSEENSLVGIHNISGAKLAKALKMGGFANPSAAVIDIARQSFDSYGEYSFILPKDLVAKKSGKNIGTFDRDAWTPIYPTVIYSHNKTSKANLNKLVEGLDEGLADKIKREVMMKVEGNGFYSGLQIVFLKDKGIELPIATVTPRYAGTIEDLQKLFGDKEVTYDNYKTLDQADKNAVTLWIKARGNKADIERINGLMEKYADKPKLIASYTEEIGYGQFDNLLYGLQADARNSGNPDYGKTIENAVNYIRENNLQEEFDVWETAVISNLGFDEKIQVGWSPSGDRIMRKNTLENVSAYMRKQGKNASSDHWSNSEGKMLAKLAQNFATLEQIRANKHRLLSDVDSTMEIRRRMNQAAQIFMDFSKSSNLFLEEQSAYAYLEDILIGGMNPDKVVAEYNKATKRNISLTEEQKAELKELREDMKSIPVQYFETKFDRPVMFSEFAAVVAPNNMPEVIENQLREAGLNIFKYDPDVEGDRREQTLKATASDSIRFMFVGEKGAAAMDAAEEATIRVDNLAVAREMESAGKDAKSIKLATGWERGADGKWRYEVPDVEVNQNAMFTFKDDGSAVTILSSLVNSEELFAAYPELEDMPVVFREMEPGLEGGYYDGLRQIHLSDAFLRRENPELNTKQEISGEDTIAHEIQHAIQDIEGFARGGHWELRKPDTADHKHLRDIVRGAISFVEFFQNSDLAQTIREAKKYNWPQWESIGPEAQEILLEYLGHKRKVDYKDLREYLSRAFDMTFPRKYGKNGYRKFAGEVEARNVEARMNMTPEQRRESLASETQDVATEDQIFLYHGMGVSEKKGAGSSQNVTVEATPNQNEQSLQNKIADLREKLQDNKNNLKSVLINIYDFMTSADIVNAMESGIGRGRYRAVLKNITTAISQAYGKSDMNIVRNILDKYLSNIEDALSQQLARQRLLEVKDILNTSIVGYTPQGVRYGKRIDESTRELFDIIRSAIAVEAPEEFTDDGRRKPVAYRLKGYTEDGDISTSFRLITDGSINKVEDTIDDIFVIAEGTPSSEEVMRAARLQYVNNILDRYDRTLEINQQIGEITNELNELEGRLAIATTEHRNAPESAKKERWADVKTLRNEKESLIQKRAQLRKSYASRLKVFTIGLKHLIENGVALNETEEGKRAEEDIKFRAGIYASIKQKGVLIYASPDYDASGKKKPKKTARKHLRGLVYESPFIATFEQMSRDIDVNSIPGQWLRSGWYYQFILGENGWQARNDWRYNTEQTLHKELTNKVKEIFGKSIIFKDKAKAVSFDIYNAVANKAQMDSGYRFERLVPKLKDGKIVGGIQDNVPLTIAQLLYIRNTCRQPNGRSGYYAWNISDFALDALINYVEANYPEYCQFADWVVSSYLPKLYEMQDAIYYKIYNTHLTKTKFYFPFVRDKRFVGTLAETGSNAVTLPSSTIGNIVERVNTTSRMDLTADMFSVLQTHTTETLDWCAYSELTRKFNMFATSKYFNNLMGEQDYSVSKLKQVFEIAIGQGQINSADNGAMTKVLNTVSKGLVAGNMVLNFNAALKQAVSMTATLGYSLNPEFEALWLKNYFTPSFIKLGFAKIIQMIKDGTLDPRESIDIKAFGDNWKWAIKNIPTLRERWEGKGVGFEQLKANGFEKWDRVINKITEWGLSPNAFMDMLTCANGAKAIYEFEYPRNIKRGLNPEEAHRDACAKAAVFINRTQQSSLNAFLASFQAGGGLSRILGTGLNAYQNSSMAFARNEWDTLRHIIRMLNKGNKAQMVNNKTDEYKAQGVEAKEAEILAKEDFRAAFASQVGGFLHSAIISNFMWTLATPMSGIVAAVASSILNWDDDEWKKFWQNESVRKQFAEALSLETLAWQMPLAYNHPILKQLLEFARQSTSGMSYGSLFQSPVVQDAQELVEAITKQWVGVLDEDTGEYKKQDPTRYDRSVEYILFSILLKSGTTVSSDVIDRMRIGIMGMIEDGEVNTEDIMNILSSPRALTRSIAGEKRANESPQEYLDRISFIHRMVNAGSGAYDDKWERERINEYLFAKDKPLYISVGIDPLDVKKAEKQAKAISKMLLIRKVGNKAIPKEGKLEVWKALSDQQKHQQIELLKLRTKIGYIDKSLLRIGLSDEDRTKLLKQRYELLVEFHNNWTKYIK